MSRFEIFVRPDVEGDFKRIDQSSQPRILSAIRNRLSESPERYGKPLAGILKGLRSLRVGDYRVVCQVEGVRVIVWGVLHRRDVYERIIRRFGKD